MHAELCQLARRWLYRRGGCSVVFVETGTKYSQERPDALGFSAPGYSKLIEVKVSRSDFLADRKKPHRQQPAQGMGRLRYYLTPAQLVQPEEVPDGWGLIWAYPSEQMRVKREAQAQAAWNRQGEEALMFAAAQRVVLRGMWHLIETGYWEETDPNPRPFWPDLPPLSAEGER